jgi:NitT/TauT family transport system ATP-binding protein
VSGAAFLEVRDVGRRFAAGDGVVTALEGVSFDVGAEEFVSIVGPSGCGKSTLAMIVAGLLPASEGRVTIAGRIVQGPQTDLGIVFQNPVLLAWRRALDNVLLQIEMRDLPVARYRERAQALLGSVGLAGFEARYPHELSGGMRQRVSICRALVHDPPLLVMDEPFGALDALSRDQMALDLQHLWSRGRKTVVFITHSIAEAVLLSDRVVVMTPRPGVVDTIVDVDLPRPRRLTVRDDPRFGVYTRAIHERFLARGVLRDPEPVA